MSKPKIDTVVTLTVDLGSINQTNKNTTVTFSDNRTTDPGEPKGKPSDYVSSVDKGKNITWQGAPAGYVDVIMVFKKPGNSGGADILKDPSNMGSGGKVTAKIKDKDISGTESYYVVFLVNGDTTNPYIIDPKIKINT
jgi:hypothetical protein